MSDSGEVAENTSAWAAHGYVVSSASGAFLLIGVAQALYGPLLPKFMRAFDVSPSSAALIISAHSIGAMIAVCLGLSRRIERRLHRRPAIASLAVALGAFTIGFSANWFAALAGAWAIGFGYGLLAMGLNQHFLSRFHKRGTSMVNFLNGVFGVGAIVAPLLLTYAGHDIRTTYVFLAIGALSVAALCYKLDDRSDQPEPSGASPEFKLSATLLPLLLVGVVIGIELCLIGWGPSVLIANGMTERSASYMLSLFFVAYVLSRLTAAFIALHVAETGLVVGALFACFGLVAAYNLIPTISAFYVLSGLGVGLLFPNTFAWASRSIGESALPAPKILIASGIGGAVFPYVCGVGAQAFGTEHALVFVAFLSIIALVLACLLLVSSLSPYIGDRAITLAGKAIRDDHTP